MRPPAGVTVSIDDGPPVGIAADFKLSADTSSHVLRYACAADACEPEVRTLSAGRADETLSVTLKIKPALLVIRVGSGSGHYTIDDYPTLTVKPDEEVRVPVRGYSGNHVTLRDQVKGTEKNVDLRAGQVTTVTF